MMGGELTASQIASHERSKAFKAKIAGRAAQLAYASSPEVLLRALPPEACAAETDPPRLVIEAAPPPVPSTPRAKFWFHIDEQRGYPSIARIQEAVCDHFHLDHNDLLSACRERRITHPRMIAIYLCRTLTPKSFPEIARRFGKRDHTTALHAYHKIRDRIIKDAAFATEIAKLKERLA